MFKVNSNANGVILMSSFIVFEYILHLAPVFLLLTLNMYLPAVVLAQEKWSN